MTSVELLDVDRAARFVTYFMENDMQVKIHRTTAAGHFRGCISREGDESVVEFAAEKYDKIMTFLSENDQQVHYASAANTVGVYAMVRLIGELRRQLRDYTRPGYSVATIGPGPPMMSPRNFEPPARTRVPSLRLRDIHGARQGGGGDATARSSEGEIEPAS